MNAGPKDALFTAAAGFLVVVGLTRAALAQDFDASSALEAASTETPTNDLSPDATKPVTPVGELRPSKLAAAPAIGAPPDESHPPPELIRQATFSAAGVVEKGSKSIRLIGIAPTALDAQCGSGADVWPCGRVARTSLQRFVRRRFVECRVPEGQPAHGIAHCAVGGRDIGEWLVSQGWAKAEGPDYAAAEKTAREQKRGIWSPVRPGVALEPILAVGSMPGNAAVLAQVDLSTQSMTLIHRGSIDSSR